MKKMYFVLLVFGLILTSCGGGGNPQGRANDLCDCFKDAGVDFDGIKNPDDLDKIGDKMSEKKGQKCVLAVLEGIEEDISDLNDKETGEYFRKFIKGVLDTDCVSEVMEDMKFDDVKDGLKDEIKRMKRIMKDSDDDRDYKDGIEPADYEDYEERGSSEEYYDDDIYDDYGNEKSRSFNLGADDYEDATMYDYYDGDDANEKDLPKAPEDYDDWDYK